VERVSNRQGSASILALPDVPALAHAVDANSPEVVVERRGRVAGVILAAGLSSRMGENKLLLRLGGESLLTRVAKVALAAGLEPLVVVLGHEPERARTVLRGLPVTTVVNPDYRLGPSTSLRAGFSALPERCGGAVVMLADMPFITAPMVEELVSRFRESDAPLVVSSYGETLAPPTLYGRALFPELRALSSEGCGKAVMKRHRRSALEVAWPTSALADLDEPSDLTAARARLERSE
jgi:molybdenum cofactor cytidylyltransferase